MAGGSGKKKMTTTPRSARVRLPWVTFDVTPPTPFPCGPCLGLVLLEGNPVDCIQTDGAARISCSLIRQHHCYLRALRRSRRVRLKRVALVALDRFTGVIHRDRSTHEVSPT
ncbi:hypothetical protein F2P81_001479 [Scophthalmus maximus]|uniref:Uncharacterized protein n=1 Tax=Scophthalmus maximus TaxID=52904 RepID=A0A6A4TMX7_SCOMX|nr:hypothetical protein F2P81_001479 [Scophthalmus maximus]